MGKLLASILKIDFLEMKERDFFLNGEFGRISK